jgi:sugar-phosphatase
MDLSFKGLLFDLDGTLINSSEAIFRAWEVFALKYQIDLETMLPTIQGKPAYESIKMLRPGAPDDDLSQTSLTLGQSKLAKSSVAAASSELM